METVNETSAITGPRRLWNKGKFIGSKPPLQPKHVWAIRTRLQLAGRTRNPALFNLEIDSKVRGCDVVRLRVEDVAPHGYARDRASDHCQDRGAHLEQLLTTGLTSPAGQVLPSRLLAAMPAPAGEAATTAGKRI